MGGLDRGLKFTRRAEPGSTASGVSPAWRDAAWVRTVWSQLERCAQRLDDARAADNAMPPAAQWISDNLHVTEEHVRALLSDLTPAFYARLPLASDPSGVVCPRSALLVDAHLVRTDQQLDLEGLRALLRAHQVEIPLAIAELWAIAHLLRLALLETIASAAHAIERELDAEAAADALADEVLALDAWPINRATP